MITKDRSYRSFEMRAADEEGMIVEGYAAKFESPTVLYEFDGVKYSEVIKRGAFNGAEMADVVMNYNHDGKPVARTKNKTLQLIVDDIGLKVRADLSGTEEGRKLYNEIKGGYLDRMSFSFKVPPGGDNYVRETRTRELNKFKRIFDVAVVDMPAYDTTNIQARSFFQAEAEKEAAEAVERRKRKLKLLIEMEV
jgi:HK97 family phage prohead protease